MPSIPVVSITVDGIVEEVEEGSLILNAAKKMGIDIPTFCSHPKLEPAAACRLCLIQVEGQSKLIPACATQVAEGMVVFTQSPTVLETRDATLEFLLANHPLDCPVCDKGGECQLQDMSYAHRPNDSRFVEKKRRLHNQDIPFNQVIIANLNRCIQCQLCTRYCDEVVGAKALGIIGRGSEQIETGFMESLEDCDHCGNCIEVCPVGALMSRPYRYKSRPWDLTEVDTICPHCGTGCELSVGVRDNELMRVRSKDDSGLNQEALCARGRFGIDFVDGTVNSTAATTSTTATTQQKSDKAIEQRIQNPMIRKNGELSIVSWHEALAYIREQVQKIQQQSKSIGGLISPSLTNETLDVFQKLMREAFQSDTIDTFCRWPLGDAYPILKKLLNKFYHRAPLTALLKVDSLLIIGSNVSDENPVSDYMIREAHTNKRFSLNILSARPSRLDSIADSHQRYLPGQESHLLNSLLDLLKTPGAPETSTLNFTLDLQKSLSQAKSITVLVGIDILRSPCVTQNLQLLYKLLENLTSSEKSLGLQFLFDRCNQLGAWDIGLNSAGDFNGMLEQCEKQQMGMLYVVGEDPLLSCPDAERVSSALAKLDLLIVQDAFKTATARQADVVLPGLTFAESDGSFTNNEGRMQRVRPFYSVHKAASRPLTVQKSIELRRNTSPTGDIFFPPHYQPATKPDNEIFNLLAKAMGKELELNSVAAILAEIIRQVPSYRKVDPTELETRAVFTTNNKDNIQVDESVSALQSATLPIDSAVKNSTSFYLITGNSMFHSGYLSEYSKTLQSIAGAGPYVELNDQDAKALSVKDKDTVVVSSPDYEITLNAKLNKYFPRGLAFVPENFKALQLNRLLTTEHYPCSVEIRGNK